MSRNSTVYIGTIKCKYSDLVESLQTKKKVIHKKWENLDYEFEIVKEDNKQSEAAPELKDSNISLYKVYKYSKGNEVPTFDPDNAEEGREKIRKRLLHSNAYFALCDLSSSQDNKGKNVTYVVIEVKPPHIGQKLVMKLLTSSMQEEFREEDIEFNFYPSMGTLEDKLNEMDEILLFKAYDLEINDGAPFVAETFELVSSKAGAGSIEARAKKNSKGIKKDSVLIEGAKYIAEEGKANLKIEGRDINGDITKYNSEEGRNLEQVSFRYSNEEERKKNFYDALKKLIKKKFRY